MNELEKGVLYVVPTPIGNLLDLTDRAKKILAEVDFVAAEDTRVSGKLLMLSNIKKPLVCYFEHNKGFKGRVIVERLKKGESCALVTDAGTPAISDPGEELVALCANSGIKVIPLAGACAAVCALSASGLPTRRFCFEGFLPEKKCEREEHLISLKNEPRTCVFYSAPHKLCDDLKDLYEFLGDRPATLSRELTKLNEEIIYSSLSALCSAAADGSILIRGEFVIIIGGYTESESDLFWSEMSVPEHVDYYTSRGLSRMDAIKSVAKDRGVGKSKIYSELC